MLYQNIKCKNQWFLPGQSSIPTLKDGLHPKKVWRNIRRIIHNELMQLFHIITTDVYLEKLYPLSHAPVITT